MENNFDSVVDMFLYEANTLLEQLDGILLRVEEQKEFSTDCINEIFRIMHTIKGSAAMMQYNSIMETAHKIEDLFFYIRENGIKNAECGEDLISLVFECTDFIKGEITKIQDGQSLTEDISYYETKIADLLNVIKGNKITASSVKSDNIINSSTAVGNTDSLEKILNTNNCRYCLRIDFDDDCGMENLRAFMIINQLKEMTSNFSFEPKDVETNNTTIKQILNEGFKIFFNDEKDLNLGINVAKGALSVKNYMVIENDIYATKQNNANTNANEGGTEQNNSGADGNKAAVSDTTTNVKHNKQSLISVNLSKLDQLSNLMGEIVITESMVMSNPEIKSLKLDSFTKATRQLEKLTDDLQNIVMSLRMVPVSGVFQKMKRIVRDMNKSLVKDVELILVGDDIEVDKNVVDSIADPLMHVVRNSMDHGIETAEERSAKGKNPKGKIVLSAVNTGGEILISVQDDGKGLNPEYIMKKAKNKGLLTKAENEYTQKEILNFIMLPGFSTNDSVTEYSGRGVGMDVVKKNIESVNGSIVLDSMVDKGTTITFKIPLTLAIVDGMQIEVGESKFIIPIKNIQQSLNITDNDIVRNTDGSESILLRNKCYQVVRLYDYFRLNTDITDLEKGILILVEVDDKGYGIFADQLLGEQKVVVKPIPQLLNKFDVKEKGIAGCSILGDGSINIILDVASIYENVMED